MKRLWNIFVLTLAINFLAVAGAGGWLYQSGRLDRPRVQAIREIVFPTAVPSTATTRPAEEASPTTRPLLERDELLAQQSHRSAADQLQFIQHAFDAKMAQLDRRSRELDDLQRCVESNMGKVAADREALESEKRTLRDGQQQATKLDADKGFQDSLALYSSMPGKQVKSAFKLLPDDTVAQYLQAMEPRVASRVVKEFKTGEELERIERVLELMRKTGAATK